MTTTEDQLHVKPSPEAPPSGVPGTAHCQKFHNRLIYHCLACGNVVHQEPEEAIPACCGTPMTPAAAETVFDAELPPPV